MRDLARNMVRNVRLGDTVRRARADPAHDAPQVPKERPVERRQRTARERELARTVVRQDGVRVLQEGDQHKPVVHPVRYEHTYTHIIIVIVENASE